jgi:hypothetical protein
MLSQHLRERFLIYTTSGETWDGLLQDWDSDHLVFVHVKALSDGKWVPFDGALWLQRFAIEYMQKP